MTTVRRKSVKKTASLSNNTQANNASPEPTQSTVLAETNQPVVIDVPVQEVSNPPQDLIQQSPISVEPSSLVVEETPIVQTQAFTQWCVPNSQASVLAEAVVGLSHRDKSLPCQDAVACQHLPRICLLVCDGAGSAAVSEFGSNALVQGLSVLSHSIESLWVDLLDKTAQDELLLERMVRIILRHAKQTLEQLVVQHRRDIRDFRSTLLMLVMGKQHLFWLKVGDGALVFEQIEHRYTVPTNQTDGFYPVLTVLGELGKGEFANQTTFIDNQLKLSDVQYGLQASAFITGLAAMSDGAAEKLVSFNQQQVSGRVSQWLDALRQQQLTRRALTQAFYGEDFNKNSTGDDRSIALAASNYS